MSPPPAKPFTTPGYLFLTTLWAILLPGVVINIVPFTLMAISTAFWDLPIFFIAIGILVPCVAAGFLCRYFRRRFSANLRAGRVPKSFTLRILPFWLPLFWGLAVMAGCFFLAPLSFDYYVGKIFFAFPQYLFLYVQALVSSNPKAFIVPSAILTFLIAMAGTVYVFLFSPTMSKTRGLILCTTITLLLCGIVYESHRRFREAILPPDRHIEIVLDEIRRNPFGRDTCLSEYVPFKENNKLVKIESPALTITSRHPLIHGAFALYPVYAAAVEATWLHTGGFDFDPYYGGYVESGTSPEAFKALLNGFDMVFMLRPSEKQLQEAKDKNIELVITPIGYEAFVFFVNKVNPVDSLCLDQIRDIYSQKTTRWDELGGRRERILPFQRPEGSGSQTAMLRVMGDVPIAPPQREERRRVGSLVVSVADYRNYSNAIGFSFRYYVEGLFQHEGVKLLKIDGVAPTTEAIQNGSYPLIGELVIISRADNTNPNVAKMTEWFLSPQGQELLKNVGYVPR